MERREGTRKWRDEAEEKEENNGRIVVVRRKNLPLRTAMFIAGAYV